MSQSTEAPPAGAAQSGPPPLLINGQFVKDLSFEVPGAPQIYATLRTAPQINLSLDVQVQKLPDAASVYEVALSIRAEAREAPAAANGQPAAEGRAAVFIAELVYAGVFTLNGVPENVLEAILMVECPRLLFPYARHILAEITREGGFPPLTLQPVDFVALWQARRAQQAAAQGAPAGHA